MVKRTMAAQRPWPAHRVAALARPRGDVFPPPARQLGVHSTAVIGDHRPGWVFLSAHGGAGATLLARLSGQSTAAVTTTGEGSHHAQQAGYGMSVGRAWPNPRLEAVPPVIVVCQTTMRGLGWARDVAAQYLSAQAPQGLQLAGVVSIADQPGRLPKPLEAARGLLTGAYAHSWHVPYVVEYRLLAGLPGDDCPPTHPGVQDVLDAIRMTVCPKGNLL